MSNQVWLKLLTQWSWEPSVWIGVALLISSYMILIGPWRSRFSASAKAPNTQITCFLLGSFVILLALISPIDIISDRYLFSVHMTQHFLLAFIAPPLLLMGTPNWLLDPLLNNPVIHRFGRILTSPLVAFFLFNVNLLIWHLPAFYELTLHSEPVHIFEHLCFITTGVMNWWPILSPTPRLPRLAYPAQILYLFLEAIPCTLLGALISFSPAVIYPTYATTPLLLGINPISDQQIAGMIMAMPAGMIYLAALTVVFFSWLDYDEKLSSRYG